MRISRSSSSIAYADTGPACSVRGKHDLTTVLPHVRLDVVRPGIVQFGDRSRGPEAQGPVHLAYVQIPRHRGRAAREVQLTLCVRRTLLVEGTVRPLGRTTEVMRIAPGAGRVAAGEVDVPQPARHAVDHSAADEEEPVLPDRRRAEVVRDRVDRFGQVHGRSPRAFLA